MISRHIDREVPLGQIEMMTNKITLIPVEIMEMMICKVALMGRLTEKIKGEEDE